MIEQPVRTIVVCVMMILAGLQVIDADQGVPPTIMHIKFERSGGFAGMRLTAAIDPKALPPQETTKVQEMVEGAKFFELPPAVTSKNPGADRFRYKVTVETKERTHTVEIDESAMPPSLRPLLDWLTEQARQRR